MKFSELSDNSTALNLRYEKGVVSFTYDDRVTAISYLVRIQCPRHRSCFYSMVPVGIQGCAIARFEPLKDLIGIDESGKYILKKANSSIGASLSGSLIALGLKADEYPYLASVRIFPKYLTYVAVPVSSEDDITLEVLNTQTDP
jgi:hypothetical protein